MLYDYFSIGIDDKDYNLKNRGEKHLEKFQANIIQANTAKKEKYIKYQQNIIT